MSGEPQALYKNDERQNKLVHIIPMLKGQYTSKMA